MAAVTAMSTKATLDFRFSGKHAAYMRACRSATINVAEGAVRAGKTVDNVFAFAYELDRSPDKIHLATGSTAANAKLNIGECNGLGLEYLFRGRCHWGKFKGNECLYVRACVGTRIVIFAGGGKSDSFKAIHGNSYGMWIATEINLHHDSMIHEAFDRQLAARRRKIFWDLNPDNPHATIYTDYIDNYRRLQDEGKLAFRINYEHFTIADNAAVTEERKREIVSQYDPSSVWYRRNILGERVAAEGLVYPMFSREKCVVQQVPQVGRFWLSVDYGILNPFSAGLWCVADGVATRIAQYYYDGRKEKHQRTDEEHYAEVKKLVAGRYIQRMVVDPSAASFIEVVYRHHDFPVEKADNSVIPGISYTAMLLGAGKIKIHESCTDCIREFEAYSWDDHKTQDVVVKEFDHAMDDTRYFAYTILRSVMR